MSLTTGRIDRVAHSQEHKREGKELTSFQILSLFPEHSLISTCCAVATAAARVIATTISATACRYVALVSQVIGQDTQSMGEHHFGNTQLGYCSSRSRSTKVDKPTATKKKRN